MGLSWSKRRDDYNPQNPSPSQPISSYTSTPLHPHSFSPSLPPPPPSSSSSSSSALVPLPQSNYNYAAPYPSQPYPIQNHYPPPPQQQPAANPYYYQYSGGGYNACGNTIYNPYYGHQSNWWTPIRPPLVVPPPPPLPHVPYVDHQQAKKIRNDVNVHKDTIRIEVDEKNPDSHLVSFTFDALVDGSITIFYFAKEGPDCRCTPLYPDAYVPVTVPFLKGLGQKFCQPSGTGIDLGFFELNDLSKPSTNEDVFPLVIYAESCKALLIANGQPDQPIPTTSHAQITEAVLDKNNGGSFQVKVIKQILWIEGVRYELREIYGIGNSAESDVNKNDSGEECVICMSEPKDTAVLPCRHMCMCSDCAKELRLQTNKCPICRQPIEELIEIKVSRGDQ